MHASNYIIAINFLCRGREDGEPHPSKVSLWTTDNQLCRYLQVNIYPFTTLAEMIGIIYK